MERRFAAWETPLALVLALLLGVAPATSAFAGHCAAPAHASAERAASSFISGGKPLFHAVRRCRLESPDGVYPVFESADPADALSSRMSWMIENSFAIEALVLHRLARNYLVNHSLSARALSGPDDPVIDYLLAPLYVAGSGGTTGFTQYGSWLAGNGASALEDNTRATCINVGGYTGHRFESIFSRELGRLILDELCGSPRMTPSATIAEFDAKTDYWTAFSEGWAAHFEAVAFDKSGFPVEVQRDLEHSLWALRYWSRRMSAEGSRAGAATLLFPAWHNRYKWAATVVRTKSGTCAGAGLSSAMPCATRSPSEVVAIPAVVSSIMYALVTDPRIQSTYRETSFYSMFAHPHARDVSGSPAVVFTPLENAYMKVFHVLARSVRPGPVQSRPAPVITFIAEYAREYPDEAEAAYDAFLRVTGGVTVDPAAAARYAGVEAESAPYARVQYERFLATLRNGLLRGEMRLDEALGPQLWILNREYTQGVCVYDRFGAVRTPYTFDLNAATTADLMTVPGMTAGMASAILATRESAGYFSTVQELAQVRALTPEVLNKIQSMKSAMDRAMGAGGPLEGVTPSLRPVAESYLTRIALRLLAAFAACLAAFIAVDSLQWRFERKYFGGWEPPTWVDAREGAGWRPLYALLKSIAGVAALAVLFVLLPPVPPLQRLAAGAGAGLAVWLAGALPQIIGISGFAGLSRRYVHFRAGWSLARLVIVTSAAFLIL